MPGKRLGYQMYACVHDQCNLVCAHLVFVGGLKGCKLRMRIQHLTMSKYIPVVSAILTLNIDILALSSQMWMFAEHI